MFIIQQGSEELVTPQLGEPACLNKSKRGFFFPDTPQSAETHPLPWLFWSPAQLLLPSSPLQLHLSSSRNKNVHRTVFFRYNTHCMGLFRVIAFPGCCLRETFNGVLSEVVLLSGSWKANAAEAECLEVLCLRRLWRSEKCF